MENMKYKMYGLLTQNIGDADIPYLLYDCPDERAQNLILLHATGFPPQLWHPVAIKLSQAYHVIVPYYCDHREADSETGAVNWMTLARDLTVFCRSLNIEKPFVAGHSMGATVAAFSQAACGLDAAAMVLIEPIFLIPELYHIPFTVSDHPFASKSIKRIDYWLDETELRQYMKSRTLFQRWDGNVLELYVKHGFQRDQEGGIRLVCSPQREAVLFMGGMKYDPWPLFPQIHCPVLVLEGENSENRIYAALEKASSLMPQGSYFQTIDAGHLIPMEKPNETANVIMEYFHGIHKKSADGMHS